MLDRLRLRIGTRELWTARALPGQEGFWFERDVVWGVGTWSAGLGRVVLTWSRAARRKRA